MDLEGVKDVQPVDDDFQHYFTVGTRTLQLGVYEMLMCLGDVYEL